MAADLLKRLKPLIDAGIDLAQMSPSRAEALVRELVRRGEVRRKEADALLALLVVRGKGATGQAAELARAEVGKQVDRMIERVARLEQTVEALTAFLPRPGRNAGPTSSPAGAPSPASPAGSAVGAASVVPEAQSGKKTPAKKTAAKKAPAKKTAAKKAPAKKTAAKKSSAKNTTAG